MTLFRPLVKLRLGTVAEGIETEEQFAFLKERDCRQYQGYFFSKPLPPEEVRSLSRTRADRGCDSAV